MFKSFIIIDVQELKLHCYRCSRASLLLVESHLVEELHSMKSLKERERGEGFEPKKDVILP